MLLVKQFISHRKNQSQEKFRDKLLEDRGIDKSKDLPSSNRVSWISQSQSSDTGTLRRVNSCATTRSCALREKTFGNPTAHSSTTSLCSCDCDANTSLKNSLSKSRSPTPSLQPLSVEDTPGDAKTWRLIFPEVQSRSPRYESMNHPEPQDPSSTTTVTGTTLDLLEVLGIDLISHDRPSTQSITNFSNINMSGGQENTVQLVRETDEVVGSIVANVNSTTHDASTASLSSTTTAHSFLKRQFRPITPPKIPLLKPFPIGKGKNFTKRKSSRLGSSAQTVPSTLTNTPRWSLTDMVDVFSGRIFKTEVDEMLTPGRILRTNNAIESKKKRQASFPSSRKKDTDESTPLEPLHLESTTLYPNTSDFPPPPFPSPFLPPPVLPVKRKLDREKDHGFSLDTRPMVFQDLNFPSPPRIPLNRSHSRLTSPLPTIPETYPLTLAPPIKPTKTPTDYVYLSSTPFTLTSPLFRHGPIRLDRLPWRRKDSAVSDEILDWTAFQMAISGNIDVEIADYRNDSVWESDEIELDVLVEWWDNFGFQEMGNLVNEAPTREQVSLDERPEREVWKGGLWARTIRNQVVQAEELGKKLRNIEMEKELVLAESPSPSSMQDLIPFPEGGIVPIGFNLGYDLGDFSWENYHVEGLSKDQ